MKGLNRAFLIGNLGNEPDLRTTASGVTLVKLSLATATAKKVGETWVESADWHRITAFGRDAEYLSKYAHKGDPLAVECVIRPNKWSDKDNVTHYEVNLIVERILWLGSPRGAHRVEEPRVDGAGEAAEASGRSEDGGRSESNERSENSGRSSGAGRPESGGRSSGAGRSQPARAANSRAVTVSEEEVPF